MLTGKKWTASKYFLCIETTKITKYLMALSKKNKFIKLSFCDLFEQIDLVVFCMV